jgi:4-aminobutyrate aminotransferase-like enzyme
VVRLAPPLVIARADLNIALDLFEDTLKEIAWIRQPAAA